MSYFKELSLALVHSFNDKTILFQTIQFSVGRLPKNYIHLFCIWRQVGL